MANPNYTPDLGEYSGQGKLRFWCQKVLPLVYDDSLSYYELLNKIVTYLNNTIDDVGTCEDNIQELLDAFEQLQEYVETQISEIAPVVEDVIDEMVESGQFGEILVDAIAGVIAEEYDPTESYVPLDYVLKDGKIYCCTANTTGVWDSTKWRETTVGDELNTLMLRVFALNAGQVSFDKTATYPNDTVGKELITLNGALVPKGALANNTDLDTVTTVGIYFLNSASTYTNAPVNPAWGQFIVTRTSENSATIFQTILSPRAVFKRYYASGSWSMWRTLVAPETSQGSPNQFLKKDEYNNAVWGDGVSSEEISQDVTAWLTANIPTGQTVAVDESLTVSGAAADSAKTGDAIRGLESNNLAYLATVVGKYINSSGNEATSSSLCHSVKDIFTLLKSF